MSKKGYTVVRQENLKSYVGMNYVVGYEFHPRSNVRYSEIAVKRVEIFNRAFIRSILKKKIQRRLDYYVNLLIATIEEEDDRPAEKALNDMERFWSLLNNRYYKFLESDYYELLVKKLENLHQKIQEKRLAFYQKETKTYDEAEKAK